jgi:diadenosine tetraphosphate (Ap4A) HIT family hydrolase
MAICPYCSVSAEGAWASTENALALWHPLPITPGHCTVAPRRHVVEFHDLDVQEQRAVWDLVDQMRRHIASYFKVDRFHIGFANFPPEDFGHTHIHIVPVGQGEYAELPKDIEWISDEEDSR